MVFPEIPFERVSDSHSFIKIRSIRRRLISVLLICAVLFLTLGLVIPPKIYPGFFVGTWILTILLLLSVILLCIADIILTYLQITYMEEKNKLDQLKEQVKDISKIKD